MAVQDGRADRALVPIENSLEGSVNATLDALVFETDEVQIVGEVVHPIQHCLIARDAARARSRSSACVSHPQASASAPASCASACRRPRSCRPHSTADAVRIVAGVRPALGGARQPRSPPSSTAARCCEAGVEDTPENETRFVWLAERPGAANRPSADGRRPWKTSIVFWGLPDAPGALVDVLQEFADREVNLSKIESRPRKQGLGRYIFFADLEGARRTTAIVEALDAVRRRGRDAARARLLPGRAASRRGARPVPGYTFRQRSGSRDRQGHSGRRSQGTGREPDRESLAQAGRAWSAPMRRARGRLATAAACWCSTPPTSR